MSRPPYSSPIPGSLRRFPRSEPLRALIKAGPAAPRHPAETALERLYWLERATDYAPEETRWMDSPGGHFQH